MKLTKYNSKYLCRWCGKKFEKKIKIEKGYSTPIICPYCKNGLKTIDDSIKLEEIKNE